MSQCSRCAVFTIRGQIRQFVEKGLYRCPTGPKWEFMDPFVVRDCRKFRPVDEKDLPARIQFEQTKGIS